MLTRRWLLLLLGLLIAWLTPIAKTIHAAELRRPNLVFVFSDQHSADMLGCYGNRDLITPNLDRLASQGVRFTDCISNSPVCTPFRGMLMSGQHPLYCGAIQNDLQILPGHGKYFGEVLRDAGYHMGYFGKWHLYGGDRKRPVPAGPFRYGFDHEFLTNNCTLWFDAKHAFYWDANGHRRLYGDWEPYAQTRQALSFIDQHSGKPFALFLSWHAPHNWGRRHEGYSAPADLLKLYDPEKLHLRPGAKDTPRIRRMYQGHMAMITSLDKSFGRLMKKLDETGLAENTIVVFTADHGDMLSSYGWPNHKGRPEQTSCRVPFLLRYPRKLKPRVSNLLLGTLNLMPTLLGLMDLPVPETCQGKNLAHAIVTGQDDVVDSQPLFFLPTNWRGIYTRRYTYSFSTDPERKESATGRQMTYNCLYDRKNDPYETKNLFRSAEHRQVRQRLHQQTLAWMKQFGDPGFVYQEVLPRLVADEDWSAVSAPPGRRPRGWEGRLKGRPVGFLTEKPIHGITWDGHQLHIDSGDYQVLGRPVHVTAAARFTIPDAETMTVADEALKLSPKKPGGFFRGTKLAGPRAGGINALGSFIESSLVIRRKPHGRPLKKGKDYLVSAPHAMLGLGPKTTLTPQDTVHASYRYSLQRVDSIAVDQQGRAHLYRGTPAISSPLLPKLPAHSVRMLSIYRPFGATKLQRKHLFPIQETPAQAVTRTTRRRIAKTLRKLQQGQTVKIVCWGDSVTVGGDASTPQTRYVDVFTRLLKAKFPRATIEVENISIGGSRSSQWLAGMTKKSQRPGLDFRRVLAAKPDLVTSEFINDAALQPTTWLPTYTTIHNSLSKIGAEWIIITPHFGHMRLMRNPNLRMRDPRPYVRFLHTFSATQQIALADASARWAHLWKEGIPYPIYLHNYYNHPDDRGHKLFAEELMKCFEPVGVR